jgi:HAE1 family hydrophobic/amphiphilic exporter-1
LSQLVVRSPVTGGLVPPDRVARLLPDTATPAQIDHAGLYPATTISFNVRPGAALGDATAAIARLQQQLQIPPEVRLSYSGSAQAFLESLQSQPWLILAALLAVYVILGVLYEDWRDPLVILSTLPSAGLGALLALWLGGFPLDVMALIGLLLLIGIVKKNGILLVDFARVAHQQGMDLSQAAVAAAVERFRPILMTTLAALLGALPLILSVGEGSELRRPLGVAVVGGLLLSQVLTLLTTPVLYVWLNRALGARLRDAGQTDR